MRFISRMELMGWRVVKVDLELKWTFQRKAMARAGTGRPWMAPFRIIILLGV